MNSEPRDMEAWNRVRNLRRAGEEGEEIIHQRSVCIYCRHGPWTQTMRWRPGWGDGGRMVGINVGGKETYVTLSIIKNYFFKQTCFKAVR